MTRLVIIDDHEALRDGLAVLLGQGGLEVVAAAGNVASGADVVADADPDVAIVDIQLPDGSGIELMEQLCRTRRGFGIALNGFGMEEEIRRSHDSGFEHHLTKPVDLNKRGGLIQQAPILGADGAATPSAAPASG